MGMRAAALVPGGGKEERRGAQARAAGWCYVQPKLPRLVQRQAVGEPAIVNGNFSALGAQIIEHLERRLESLHAVARGRCVTS